MTLATAHPAYDPALELIALLPISDTPRGKVSAWLEDLREDLGLRSQFDVTRLATEAERAHGLKIVDRREDSGVGRPRRFIALHPSCFAKAAAVGGEYVRAVYGE